MLDWHEIALITDMTIVVPCAQNAGFLEIEPNVVAFIGFYGWAICSYSSLPLGLSEFFALGYTALFP